MTAWTALWLLWGAAFLLIEGVALLNKSIGDTLSEHFWRWLKAGDRAPTWLVWAGRAGVLAFCAWLGLHLSFGWFTPTHPWPF
jgi:hypothetical protein